MEVEYFYRNLESKAKEYLLFNPKYIIDFNRYTIERQNVNPEFNSIDYYEDIVVRTYEYKTLIFWVGYNPKLEELRACPVEIVNSGVTHENYDRKSFFLHEYLNSQNIDYYDCNYLKGFVAKKQLIDSIEKYLLEIKQIIKNKGIQKILNTDYWIEIPLDWGPYK